MQSRRLIHHPGDDGGVLRAYHVKRDTYLASQEWERGILFSGSTLLQRDFYHGARLNRRQGRFNLWKQLGNHRNLVAG